MVGYSHLEYNKGKNTAPEFRMSGSRPCIAQGPCDHQNAFFWWYLKPTPNEAELQVMLPPGAQMMPQDSCFPLSLGSASSALVLFSDRL